MKKVVIERLLKITFDFNKNNLDAFCNDKTLKTYSESYRESIILFLKDIASNDIKNFNTIFGLLDTYLISQNKKLSQRLSIIMIRYFAKKSEDGYYLIGDYKNKRILRESKIICIRDDENTQQYIDKNYPGYYLVK